MKLFKQTLLAAAVLSSAGAMAQTTAIINAQIHTASEQGVIKNGSVIIEDGKIKAITTDAATADVIIDAQGKIVTPGFIGSIFPDGGFGEKVLGQVQIELAEGIGRIRQRC